MRKILILCHGNICRSPMAEFIFKDKINKYHLEDKYYVESKALTSEEIGNDIYPPAKSCLKRHDIPFASRKASKFNLSDYDQFDEIYVMDDSNMQIIKRICDDPLNKIKLLNGYIEDPWYTGNYDKVFDLIEDGINKLIFEDI